MNPEMTDALLVYSIARMKEHGIVDSGDALKLGIGAMTDAKWKSFFDKMVRVGVVKAGSRLATGLHITRLKSLSAAVEIISYARYHDCGKASRRLAVEGF